MSASQATVPPARDPLPPGQVWGRKFVIYAALGIPNVDVKGWKLKVSGLVEKPLEFTYDELLALPMKQYAKSFYCLLPSSIVFAKPRPIAIEDVREGTEVVGHDGLPHKVTRLIRMRHAGKIIGVKASYLPPSRMTPDHPVWVVKGHPGYGQTKSKRRKLTFKPGWKPVWVRADQLRVGDYVLFPKYRYVSTRDRVASQGVSFRIDEKLARLVGWYLAEGSASSSYNRTIGFALNSNEVENEREIRGLLEELLGARVGTYLNYAGTGMTLVATSSKAGYLRLIFGEWCGTGAANKYIPDFIMDAEKHILKEFLVRYFRGDGYSKEASRDDRNDLIDFTTSSRVLAYQLLLALSKLDIPGELVNHPGSVRMGFSVRVRGQKIRNLLPEFRTFERIDRFRYKETSDGFYYPITKLWMEEYCGDVYDFQAPPAFTMLSPFVTQDCVTKWSIEKPMWEGVPIKLLADMAQVKPEATWVMYRCYEGYTAPVPVEDALREDSIVALKLNGKPLLPEQGFPARPFMPDLYGWKSAKWLTEIEFIPKYVDGYWETYGYHERGNVWEEERFKGHSGKNWLKRAFGTA
jgi:DMSO/TMAO reductase YedYZ molybdopterin-dependent catalytic subunit